MKQKINVEEIQELYNLLDKINSLNFDDIIWLENGQSLVIDSNIIDEWKFTGLSNAAFAEMKFWEVKL